MKVEEIVGRDVGSCSPEEGVDVAARIMRAETSASSATNVAPVCRHRVVVGP